MSGPLVVARVRVWCAPPDQQASFLDPFFYGAIALLLLIWRLIMILSLFLLSLWFYSCFFKNEA